MADSATCLTQQIVDEIALNAPEIPAVDALKQALHGHT
jgi:hypothetical protein